MDPQSIGTLLGIVPTEALPIDPASKYRHRRQWHVWQWSTEYVVESRENLEHLQAITGMLEGKAEKLAQLRAQGCLTDIFCYWISSGQGGPYLNSPMIASLAELGLEIAWDMYFGDESNYNEDGSRKSPRGIK